MNQHSRPIWLAAMVAPVVSPFVLVLWSTLTLLFETGTAGLEDWPVLIVFFAFGLPPAYAAMLILGLPYVLWLRSRKALTFPLVCIGAMLSSMSVGTAYFWFVDPLIPPTGDGILLLAALGFLSGMVFCLVAGIKVQPIRRLTGIA